MKTVYQIDKDNAFVCAVQADESPLEPGVWLIPAGCVDLPPPPLDSKQAAVWRDGAWRIVEDHRGETWFDKSGQEKIIDELGPVPEGYSKEPLPPPPLDIAALKARAKSQIVAYANNFTRMITARYPEAEVASWPTQEAEAQRVLEDGDAADAPLIALMAQSSIMPLAEFAALVMKKAAAYRAVVAYVQSLRGVAEAAIDAATTPEEIDLAIINAQETSAAQAKQLGIG